jgi:ABC-type dipeptide/oligopeptide/nickel transport system permease component
LQGVLDVAVVSNRLLTLPLVLALVVLVVFSVFEALPSEAAIDAGISADSALLDARDRARGGSEGVVARAWDYLRAAATGDLGTSRIHRRPVVDVIAQSLGPTFAYAIPAFALALGLAVASALHAAQRPGAARDVGLDIAAVVSLSVSALVVVVFARDFVAFRLGWADVAWPLGDGEVGLSALWLPTVLWAAVQWGADHRHLRALFVVRFRAPWVDGWRARGLPPALVRRRVFLACLPQVAVRVTHRLPHLLVGGVVIEEIFNVPGTGRLVVDALRGADHALLAGLGVVMGAATVTLQAGAEAVAHLVDPASDEESAP